MFLVRGKIMNLTILRFVGIVAMVLFIAAPWRIAGAADMPLKAAAPVVAPEYNWSGFYGGVNGGWSEERFNWAYTNPSPVNCCAPFSASANDAVIGAHVGAQWQWNHVVLGAEAGYFRFVDSNWASRAGCISGGTQVCQVNQADVLTFGGRLGWAWDKWLFYGSGGGAQGGINSKLVNGSGSTFDTTVGPNYRGWYAGFGSEYLLNKGSYVDVLVGLEYQHIDLGTRYNGSSADNFSASGANGRNITVKDDVVRFRLSLKVNPFAL
jgi:outer membrane immunogenic protein